MACAMVKKVFYHDSRPRSSCIVVETAISAAGSHLVSPHRHFVVSWLA